MRDVLVWLRVWVQCVKTVLHLQHVVVWDLQPVLCHRGQPLRGHDDHMLSAVTLPAGNKRPGA